MDHSANGALHGSASNWQIQPGDRLAAYKMPVADETIPFDGYVLAVSATTRNPDGIDNCLSV
jgi:hypothetical protein